MSGSAAALASFKSNWHQWGLQWQRLLVRIRRGGCHAGKTPTGAAKADASLGKLLTTKSVILGGMIFAFQQFAGINAIIYFSSSVFAQVPS